MSILNGPFQDKAQMQGSIEFAQRVIENALPELDEGTRRIIEMTSDGSTLAEALGLGKEHLEALLETGCRLVQAGKLDAGADVLMRLNQLDPLEERALYALGVVAQTRGELHKAAQLYLQFLALDATSPMGYLRLGECLLAAKEYAEARSAFAMARTFADEGKGQPGDLELATEMLALPEIAAARSTKVQ